MTMFESEHFKTEDCIEIKDTDEVAFGFFLEYLYTGNVALPPDVNIALEIMALAFRYMVNRLARFCEYELSSRDQFLEYALDLYLLCKQFQAKDMQKSLAFVLLDKYGSAFEHEDEDRAVLLDVIDFASTLACK